MLEERRVVGQNVSRYRKANDWTQEMLAARVHLSSDYISRLELGKENPTLDVMVRLSIVFERKVVDLFDEEVN